MTETKKHNLFSASSASRWIACPGSIKLSEKAPPARESKYADEGTRAHVVLEALLKFGRAPYCEDTDMLRHAEDAWHLITLMTPEGATVLSETKCPLKFIHDDMGGTTDCVIVEPYGKLIVIDFKYGVVPVSAKENPQLIAYALSMAHEYEYEFSSVELVIIQPRALDVEENGAIRKHSMTIDELKLWRGKFTVARDQALGKNPALRAGDHCKYCPAGPICPELRDTNLKTIRAEFEPETGVIIPPAQIQAIPNLGAVLEACDNLETWISKVRDHAYQVLESGGQVEGFKLVEKRSIRKWSGPAQAATLAKKRFRDLAFSEPELLSPAQFEKKIAAEFGKETAEEFLADHVVSKSSGTTLVPESDPRPAFNFFEAEFKEIPCTEVNASVKSVGLSTSKTPSSSRRSATIAEKRSKPTKTRGTKNGSENRYRA